MTSNGLRLAGGIWLVAQIVQGLLLLYVPFWQFLSSQVEDARPGAYGALMLLIAASCLIPVAMETWRSANRLLGGRHWCGRRLRADRGFGHAGELVHSPCSSMGHVQLLRLCTGFTFRHHRSVCRWRHSTPDDSPKYGFTDRYGVHYYKALANVPSCLVSYKPFPRRCTGAVPTAPPCMVLH